MKADAFYIGVDVGTGSARAGVFDSSGKMLGAHSQALEIWRPQTDFVQQSSEQIWRACCTAVREAVRASGIPSRQVRGIGFDATCSLVLLDENDRPVTVSPDGDDNQNVIVWMDHRALREAAEINSTRHPVLRYVGGTISPEMETPKLLWLKRHLPRSWSATRRFLDLPDFLVYRATGSDVRSLCSTVCKWTYLGHEGRWDSSYFEAIDLGELAQDKFARIGTEVSPIGISAGKGLTARAADELGLETGTAVSTSIIDAHAGGIGTLGVNIEGQKLDDRTLQTRLALICGTSSCHMAVSHEPLFIEGIWGPYFSAMLPGKWLTEGGQSATGALIDHIIDSHSASLELKSQARSRGVSPYELLNARIAELSAGLEFPAALTRDFHLLPYFHGNRSPRANPFLKGSISGLGLERGIDALALQYLAAIQGIAYGTRHIIEEMNRKGYSIDTIVACGGLTKNPVFLREHADITGCRIVLPREPEAVLLGAAILGAAAAGEYRDLWEAASRMSASGAVLEPTRATAGYHLAKYGVFHQMHADQLRYEQLMRE